ncbi:hypothetical protein FT641_18850 [Bacillus paranthracis]|uniref:hypothetical protein n=1 Tax=Bacillus paranthracis TaxID=2026186 RepID=UPI0018792BD7|nr:hypothetical protein [Bacillus paranthracis]MBE7114376.1 hypothetical protein [Bacillus paranthracis]MBE7154751.1 hypothetical protein [Bacillus paranthracis]
MGRVRQINNLVIYEDKRSKQDNRYSVRESWSKNVRMQNVTLDVAVVHCEEEIHRLRASMSSVLKGWLEETERVEKGSF